MTLRSFLTMTPRASMRSLPSISSPPSSCRSAFVSMSSKWWWPLPIPYSFVVPFSWKQCLRIPIFTSHLAVVTDVSAHPLLPVPPPVCSHSELFTMCKNHLAASLDPFIAMLTLCSNGLPHDNDDMDEL
ncbi:hypothetical protein BHM03_00025751 [Ensete ventricosum]|nr:hypothetical protein BHM03_00025751 [Ensete ventricosum]